MKINYESTSRSIFSILPVKSIDLCMAMSSNSAATILDHRMDRPRLLIVEDNGADAVRLRTMVVESFGKEMDIAMAHSLGEALEAIRDQDTFHFVLLDLGLPDCKGLEVLRRFIVAVPLVTAIIAMSTRENEGFGVGALQEGAQDYLVKSRLTTHALSRAISNAWERQRARARTGELAALLDIAQDAIIVCDMFGLVTYWNRGAQTLFGWSPEEARRCAIGSLLRLSSDKSMCEVFRTVLDRGGWRGDLCFIDTGGKVVSCDTRWSVVRDHHGNPASYLCVCTDITSQRQGERRQAQAVLSGIEAALHGVEEGLDALRPMLDQTARGQALRSVEEGVHKAIALLHDAAGMQIMEADGSANLSEFSGQGELILIVDDEEYVRELLRAMLEKCGYKVLCAGGGEEAIRVYCANRIDIKAIVVDMMMPVMDGEDTMREIRKFAPDARFLPISGVPTKALPLDSSRRNFLSKPFSRCQLLYALRQIIERPEHAHGTGMQSG